MGNFKHIFNVLLVIQACSVSWAVPYGHPDSETVDIGSQLSPPPRDQYVIEAAVRRGMDGDAVAELLRTKQPVVKVKVESNGDIKTTTYKLDRDGSISTSTVTEKKSVRHFEAGSLPDSVSLDDLLNSPSGTVSRTFIDKDGSKVTQTYSVSNPKTSSIFDSGDNSDWSIGNAPNWINSEFPSNVHHSNVPQDAGPTNYHKTVSTYTGPNGKKSVVESWSSGTGSPAPEHNFPSTNWQSFNLPEFPQPWQPRDTSSNAGEWTVVKGHPDVETTTRHKFPSWTPRTWDSPEIPSTETTNKQRPFQPKATTPLPSLEDFLKNQYVPSAKNTPTTTPSTIPSLEDFLKPEYNPNSWPKTTSTTTPSSLPSLEDFLKPEYNPASWPKTTSTTTKTATTMPRSKTATTTNIQPPVTIKVEDLPVTQILHNGVPADESVINLLPPHLKPKSYTGTVHKIENIPPIETNTTPQKVETNIRKITKTHIGNTKPTLAELDPQMREILRKAGISPEDITNIDGDTITKTRSEPDGRTITTTYKVRTTPTAVTSYEQTQPRGFSTSDLTPSNNPHRPSPISEFLAKVGLTESNILAKNGEYTRTFIDDDGQVLTATFVLSRPMNEPKGSQHKEKPLK